MSFGCATVWLRRLSRCLLDFSAWLLEVIRVYVVPYGHADVSGSQFRGRLSTHPADAVRSAIRGAWVCGVAEPPYP